MNKYRHSPETRRQRLWTLGTELVGGAAGERRRLEELVARRTAELAEAKEAAERASNAKSRFLAAASHDLRQPLSALSVYVGVLESKLPAADARLLANMRDCVLNLNEMLSDLLDLSKLEAGVVAPNVGDFAIDELLTRVVATHAPEAEAKGLSLRFNGLGIVGRTDPVLFQRIVGNLVANAVRYTERGGILIGCRRHQGKTWIEVWDSGIGIPADKTAEIFEEFKQLSAQHNKGTGLGLAIVAKAAALLGLQVRLRSQLGRGSMFAVELPRGDAATPTVRCRYVHRPLRIALAEANPAVAAALGYALTGIGHELVTAASRAELLARLAGVAPDFVIAAYGLGEECGLQVISSLRAAYGNGLPALIITSDTRPELVDRLAGERIRVLHKPLDLDALRAIIAELTA